MTIRELIADTIKKAKGFKDFELEAIHFLLEEILGLSRSEMILNYNSEIDTLKYDYLTKCIDEYVYNHYPVQYLVGYTYFYNNKFYVNENVLIPRFDTEVVVENAIDIIKKEFKDDIRIVDVGCGSGAIAITLYKNISSCVVDAIDISSEALLVAKRNARELDANINFIENDMLKNIVFKYDVIISNPPYIDVNEDIMDLVRNNEPKLALFSDDGGLYHYKTIILQSLECLKESGIIIFEIPDNKCDVLSEFVYQYYSDIEIIKDYNNQRRVMIIRK